VPFSKVSEGLRFIEKSILFPCSLRLYRGHLADLSSTSFQRWVNIVVAWFLR
jgi:hypothetical protein